MNPAGSAAMSRWREENMALIPELPEDLYDFPFFDLDVRSPASLSASLADLSGCPSRPGPHETPMIRRCEEAWATPLRKLTCEQIRLLLGQQMGLEWLGKPILEFVSKWPAARVANYPGEMTLSSLRAAQELSNHVPVQLREWLQGDFTWMEEAFAWDDEGELLAEGGSSLAAARTLLRIQ